MRKTLELAGLAMLAVLFWMTWSALDGPNHLPNRVPTHFDSAGNPNAWGSPRILFLLPTVAAGVYLLITVLASIPSTLHYPMRANSASQAWIKQETRKMVSLIKVEMVCLFIYVQRSIIEAARNNEWRMSWLTVPVFMVVVLGTVGWYLFRILTGAKAGAGSSDSQ